MRANLGHHASGIRGVCSTSTSACCDGAGEWVYSFSVLGTDRYPPFSLQPADYPADLTVQYPERVSRGSVLVKWWLLAIPQYLVTAVFGGGWWVVWWEPSDTRWSGTSPGLIGLLVLFAAVGLLFTGALPTVDLRARDGSQPVGVPRRRLRRAR